MQNSQPRVDKLARWVGLALAIGYFVLAIIGTKTAPVSWNDISRVASIQALGEHGTWAIDDSPWIDQTQDKVFLNGKFYSDKMPLLTWVAAGVYGILHGLGFSLAPDCVTCAYYPLTVLFVGLPASVLLGLLFDFARSHNLSLGIAFAGTTALGLGTMILPYSLVLNHHVPGAVSLFAAFYLLTVQAHKNERWLLGVGFFSALAIAFDPISGILAVALGVVTWVRFRQRTLYFLAGALVPLLLTAWLDVQIAGTIIPPYLIPSGYAYPGSTFPATVGGNGAPDDPAQYAFKMFLGAQGLFAYNPILFFAGAGVGIVALTRKHALQIEALAVGISFIILCFYLATRTGNLGGEAYGERWFVQAIPLLMAFLFFAPPLAKIGKQPWRRWLSAPFFVMALLVSIYSSYQGAQNPWRYVPPPFHLTRNSETGVPGWRSNIRLP